MTEQINFTSSYVLVLKLCLTQEGICYNVVHCPLPAKYFTASHDMMKEQNY